MGDNDQQRKLFTEFPPVPTEAWEEKIRADLKGADYQKKLVWKTDEGFLVKPYYRHEDLAGLEYLQSLPGECGYTRGNRKNNNDWLIRRDIVCSDSGEANKLAIDAIAKGVDALGFCSLDITNHKQMNRLLSGIDLLKTNVNFMSSRSFPLTLELFLYEISVRRPDLQKISGSLNFDPISYLLLHGDFYTSQKDNFDEAEYLVSTIQKNNLNLKAITVNGQYFREAGSTIVQELAFSLASANEYLSGLTSRGVSPDAAARNLLFTFGIGSGYFLEMAKLRAARYLWSRMIGQYNPLLKESYEMFIHATTLKWNKTVYDPYVNMLRTVTEGMAAAIGNADSITVLPFDIAYAEPGKFSYRIALNQQLILKDESHLDKVADPAAGSYFIENLTHSIVVHAWDLFLAVEEKGGIIECIRSGFIQDEIGKSSKKKETDIAFRNSVLIGTNQYPNLGESMLEKAGHLADNPGQDNPTTYKKLKMSRIAESIEMMRLAVEKDVLSGKKRPSVYLLTFGDVPRRKARANFSTNFFGCAGYQIIEPATLPTIEESISKALESKAEIVVVCSSDEEYASVAPVIAAGLKKVNPEIKVVVAGYPKEIVETLKNSGIDDFVHLNSDLVETLKRFEGLRD